MNLFRSGIYAAGLSLATALPAAAELTVGQAREAIFGLYDSLGYQVSIGAEEAGEGTITLRDVSASFPLPEGAGTIALNMGTITLSEVSGSVEVIYPDSMELAVDAAPPGKDPASLRGAIDFTAFGMLLSGDPDAIRIESGADAINFRVVSLVVDGKDIPLNVTLDSSDIETDYSFTKGEGDRRRIEGKSSVGTLALKANAVKPGGGGAFTGEVTMTGLEGGFLADAVAIDFANPADAIRILAGEFAFGADMSTKGTTIKIDFVDGRDRFALDSSSAGGRFLYDLTKQGFEFAMSQTGVALTFSSSEIPFPSVSLAYDELGLGFDVPLAASGEPQDFGVSTALRNLTVDESLWAMIDPGQTLPRDPVTIALALSGKVMVLVDLLDPQTLMQLEDMDAPPMLPVSASLDELLVSFGGAKLTGDGQATLDLATAKVVDGIPMPVGAVNLKLTGAFGLMDKLANMGLIPPDVSMMARGVIGAFAKPVGEDDFESTLEITEDGAIMANGQRVQ